MMMCFRMALPNFVCLCVRLYPNSYLLILTSYFYLGFFSAKSFMKAIRASMPSLGMAL